MIEERSSSPVNRQFDQKVTPSMHFINLLKPKEYVKNETGEQAESDKFWQLLVKPSRIDYFGISAITVKY